MAKTKRKWLVLEYNDPDSLRSEHIGHSEHLSIKNKIDNIDENLLTLELSANDLYDKKANIDSPVFINKILIPNGSYNTPSIQFENDTDTGIYRPGPNQIGFTTNGTGKLIINNTKSEFFNELQPKQGINLPEGKFVKYNNEEISANNLFYNAELTIKDRMDMLLESDFYHTKAIIIDKRGYNVNGGTFTQGEWRTHVLNTIEYNTIGISLSNNIIKIPKGLYSISFQANSFRVNNFVYRLYDITNEQQIALSNVGYSNNANQASALNVLGECMIQFNNDTDIELQGFCSLTRSNDGFGLAHNLNINIDNIYAKISISKLKEIL